VSHVDSQALRAARGRAGLTQHQLAHLVGVAGGERVSRWERGVSEPRPDILVRLSKILGLTPLELLDVGSARPDLRALRFAAGLTATEAAARAHVAKPTYERWEAGNWKRLPGPENLRGLARGLDVSMSVMLDALEQARIPQRQSPEE